MIKFIKNPLKKTQAKAIPDVMIESKKKCNSGLIEFLKLQEWILWKHKNRI